MQRQTRPDDLTESLRNENSGFRLQNPPSGKNKLSGRQAVSVTLSGESASLQSVPGKLPPYRITGHAAELTWGPCPGPLSGTKHDPPLTERTAPYNGGPCPGPLQSPCQTHSLRQADKQRNIPSGHPDDDDNTMCEDCSQFHPRDTLQNSNEQRFRFPPVTLPESAKLRPADSVFADSPPSAEISGPRFTIPDSV